MFISSSFPAFPIPAPSLCNNMGIMRCMLATSSGSDGAAGWLAPHSSFCACRQNCASPSQPKGPSTVRSQHAPPASLKQANSSC
eukprot:6670275-Alexandrium_andersonii.AAC.1